MNKISDKFIWLVDTSYDINFIKNVSKSFTKLFEV